MIPFESGSDGMPASPWTVVLQPHGLTILKKPKEMYIAPFLSMDYSDMI